MKYSKNIEFLEASLLGGNLHEHVYDLIDAAYEALQRYVTLAADLEMNAQNFHAGAWSDGLAIKESLNVFLELSFGVRAHDKKL